jgi:hypothetical protein
MKRVFVALSIQLRRVPPQATRTFSLANDAGEHDVRDAARVAALQAEMTVVQNQFFASAGMVTALAFLIGVLFGAF